ncbi:MAG: 2Fe-2S iron-sulfur cluster binding domain-containing protein [Roseiarcus sp.]
MIPPQQSEFIAERARGNGNGNRKDGRRGGGCASGLCRRPHPRNRRDLPLPQRREPLRGAPVGCRNGGCSVRRIEILSGRYAQHWPMSREYASDDDLAANRVLAYCINLCRRSRSARSAR